MSLSDQLEVEGEDEARIKNDFQICSLGTWVDGAPV